MHRREVRFVEGYPHGPTASIDATDAALDGLDPQDAILAVEGVSDQIAVETLAAATGIDLAGRGVSVVPIGGAHAIGRFVEEHGTRRLLGLVDRAEAHLVARALARRTGTEVGVADLDAHGFAVLDPDLEGAMLTALGERRVLACFAAEDDDRSWQRFVRQPAWRDRGFDEQARRFIGARARRKSRYADVFARAAVAHGVVPRPLTRLLERC